MPGILEAAKAEPGQSKGEPAIGSKKATFSSKILYGVGGVAGVYWVFEVFLQFGATDQPTLVSLLLGSDIYEILRRIVVLIFFIILGSHVQYTLEKREQAERALLLAKEEESKLQALAMSLSTELNLGLLLQNILDTSIELLVADRGTLFIYDQDADELHSLIALGLKQEAIRFPSNLGLAGASFTEAATVNSPDVYSDPRFNREIDQITGYITRTVLCVPVRNKKGRVMGVFEIINKKEGVFTAADEKRLETFAAHVSVAIENAALFDDVLSLKNYNESVLNSMTNGVISIDGHKRVVKCNAAAVRILGADPDRIEGTRVGRFFDNWLVERIDRVMESRDQELALDTEITAADGTPVSVNLSAVPLIGAKDEVLGTLMILEDITSEKRLKSTMARYMTKEVAEKLLQSGESVLGGNTQEATVLFSDIRGFTTIAEKCDPQETVSMLNEYFTIMVDVVFGHRGILDKYLGDGLMAVFGAPVASDRDPDNSVTAAIEMMLALQEFNRKRALENQDPIDIGIGINTDEVLSGNIGSIKRMDYTVIGDGVNLAFRLEQANKFYMTNILVSDFTYRLLKRQHLTRKVDLIRVKGKTEPVTIHQVLDYHNDQTFPHLDEILGHYRQGLACYDSRDWKKGIEFFDRALQLNPNDHPSLLFRDRCLNYLENPPDDDWDGVCVLDETKFPNGSTSKWHNRF